jgi:hypothetical protein
MPPIRRQLQRAIPREILDITKDRLAFLSHKQSDYECAMSRMAERISLFDKETTQRVYNRAIEAYQKFPGAENYPCNPPSDLQYRETYYAQIDAILNQHASIRTFLE